MCFLGIDDGRRWLDYFFFDGIYLWLAEGTLLFLEQPTDDALGGLAVHVEVAQQLINNDQFSFTNLGYDLVGVICCGAQVVPDASALDDGTGTGVVIESEQS